MWIESVLQGILIGVFRGGRLSYLGDLKIKHINIFMLGMILQLVPFFLGKIFIIREYSAIIVFIAYMFVFLFLLLNYKIKGMGIIILGSAINLAVLVKNDLKMPVNVNSITSKMTNLKLAIKTGEVSNYIPIESIDGPWDYFAKIIHLPEFYPLQAVISIQDIIISIGIIYLIQNTIVSRRGFFI